MKLVFEVRTAEFSKLFRCFLFLKHVIGRCADETGEEQDVRTEHSNQTSNVAEWRIWLNAHERKIVERDIEDWRARASCSKKDAWLILGPSIMKLARARRDAVMGHLLIAKPCSPTSE